MAKLTRKIVKIDEDLCDGCGLCVPGCAEGAIRIINGKAKLIADNLCDGLGNCLGECPRGAISIEERPADAFDEAAVAAVTGKVHQPAPASGPGHAGGFGGCPGSRMRMLQPKASAPAASEASTATADQPSQLGHWPVQLRLVPTAGPMWQNADVLIAADCVPFAMADFHQRLLAGRSVAIGCPKLDDVESYVQKLAEIFRANSIQSVTIAHMQVPCCNGIVWAVRQALALSGRQDIPVTDVTVGIDGAILSERSDS